MICLTVGIFKLVLLMGLIRILLALSVVAAHCGPIFGFRLVGGQIAVQTFYIISGFYMSLILNEKYIGVNGSYSLFVTNRAIRLFPIYWTVLLLTILVALLERGTSFPTFAPYLAVEANFFSTLYLLATNLIILGQDLVLFLGIDPATGTLFFTSNFATTKPPLHSFLFIPQAWSLGIEMTFYLIAPFVLRKGLKIVLVIMCLSFLLRLFIYNFLALQNDPWTYRFFPTEIVFFLTGYVSYLIYLRIKDLSIPRYAFVLIFSVAVAFTIFFSFLPPRGVHYFPFALRELAYFCFIALALPVLFNFTKRNKVDSLLGELSYPIYVSHLLVAAVCYLLPYEMLKTSWFVCLTTIAVAWVLNSAIAMPVERFRQARLVKVDVPLPTQV